MGNKKVEFNKSLVVLDKTDISWKAFDYYLKMLAGHDDTIIILHLTSCIDFGALDPFVKRCKEKLAEVKMDFEKDRIELWIQKIDENEFKDAEKIGDRIVKALESNKSDMLVFGQAKSNERPEIQDFVNYPMVGSYIKENSKANPLFIRE